MSMDTLCSAKLVIRPFTMDDLEAAHRLLDLDLEWSGEHISIEQRRERLAFHVALARWEAADCLYGDRVIVLREKGDLIGICGFRPWICSPAERALYPMPPPVVTRSTPPSLAWGAPCPVTIEDRATRRRPSGFLSSTRSRKSTSDGSWRRPSEATHDRSASCGVRECRL